MQWSPGAWQTTASGTHWQGEQWVQGTCAEFATTENHGHAPGWPRRTGGRTTDLLVQASIQTLRHSFYVQNYWGTPAGTGNFRGSPQGFLRVTGSIAQKWRGAVGTANGNTGYKKDYRYDARLRYSAPPYFPQWSNAKWGARYTGEVQPRYRGGP
jgi:hypothetical protein